MPISMKELLSGNSLNDVPLTAQRNLEELQKRLNVIRDAWGKPMLITSGFRSMQHHVDIYRTKALREKRSFSHLQVPMSSRHLSGEAADVSDPDGSLHAWCKQNVKLLEEVGLWLEEKDSEKRVHFQTKPPRSGRRFFLS